MITLLGATPVMIDVDRDTLMVHAQKPVEAAITPRTHAIMPVHYAGAPVISTPFAPSASATVFR